MTKRLVVGIPLHTTFRKHDAKPGDHDLCLRRKNRPNQRLQHALSDHSFDPVANVRGQVLHNDPMRLGALADLRR